MGTSCGDPQRRISAKRQQLLLACKSVLHPPQPPAGWRDKQEQAAFVRKFDRLPGASFSPLLRKLVELPLMRFMHFRPQCCIGVVCAMADLRPDLYPASAALQITPV